MTFDSTVERDRYLHLCLLERAGEISDLELQPEYVLLNGFKRNGKAHRGEKYIGDFRYKKNGKTVVEDVKGVKTAIYLSKIKRLLFLYADLVFLEVTKKRKNWDVREI